MKYIKLFENYNKDRSGIKFTDEVTNSYSGQVNCTSTISKNGEFIGYVDYVLYNNELTVSYISIDENKRRLGYASLLMNHIKKINPKYTYKPSYTTDLGNQFKEKDYMIYYHGGDLDKNFKYHKKGRYEFGVGLYATERLDEARKYAKGNRKIYQLIVEKGNDINDVKFDTDKCIGFIKYYAKVDKRKELIENINKKSQENKIPGYFFQNIILNDNAITHTNTANLREFLVKNGADYEIHDKTFGFPEKMIVIFNMNKIVKTIQIR